MSARLLVVLLALVAAGCSGGSESEAQVAETTTVTRTETLAVGGVGGGGDDVFGRIPELVAAVEPSIVTVSTDRGEGSGVVYDGEGAIVTNNHVIAGARTIEVVLASGARLDARVEAADELSDLAVLRVEREGLPAVELADELPRVGELVVALGNPLGFEQSVSAGIVSGLSREIPSGGRTPALIELIQTDAAISPGNSGGALVNADGQVIGINVAFIPPAERAVSLGFAIPSTVVTSVVRQLLETGKVERAYLGIRPIQVTPELAAQLDLGVDQGAAVESVGSRSAAERGGVRGGDVIVSIDGTAIATVEDLFALLRKRRPGERVAVTVVRDGERRQLDVRLGERPQP